MTTEELHLQSKAGRTNEQTNRKTICPHTILCGE